MSQFYSIRMRLRGMPGPIRLHMKDSEGPEGNSLLQADYLPVLLSVGETSGLDPISEVILSLIL